MCRPSKLSSSSMHQLLTSSAPTNQLWKRGPPPHHLCVAVKDGKDTTIPALAPNGCRKSQLFPTLTCGVFVFSAAPLLPPDLLPPSHSHTSLTHTLTHTHSLSHTHSHSLTHSLSPHLHITHTHTHITHTHHIITHTHSHTLTLTHSL